MSDLIAASSLSQASELIAECGGDAEAILHRFGIAPDAVGAYDRFLPFTTMAGLVGTCASELEVPDFALRLAARQDPDILGPLAIASRNAESVGEALLKITEFAHVYSPAIATRLRDEGDSVRYEFDIVLGRVPFRPHAVELALGVTLSTIRMLSGERFHPTRVSLTHPAMADPATYRAHFGCPVDFEAPSNGLLLPSSLMTQRLHRADALAHDLAVRYLLDQDRDTPFEDVVSALIGRSLPTGAADLANIAQLLAMHPRAVQRRLAEGGTTFERLLDDARRDLTLALLSARGVPLSTIARQLGYAEQSVLTRSCRRWFGVPPLVKRRELVGGAARGA